MRDRIGHRMKAAAGSPAPFREPEHAITEGVRRFQRGGVLVEFSLLILVLMLLTLGAFDFGLALEQGIVVSSAAHAGAVYGASEGNANGIAGMQTAALNAAKSLGSSMTATATTWCTCVAGSSTTVSCSSLCSTYNPPMQYVQVQTSITVPVLFHFSGLPLTIPLSGNSILRAR